MTITKSIRTGIKHIWDPNPSAPTLNLDEFKLFVGDGRIKIERVFEKVDGVLLTVNYDDRGMFIRWSGVKDDSIRSPADVQRHYAAKDKEDAPVNRYFQAAVQLLSQQKCLLEILRQQYEQTQQVATIRGELLLKATHERHPHDPSKIKFNKIYYDEHHFGRLGAFVIFTSVEDNHWVDLKRLQACSNRDFVFLTDETVLDEVIEIDAKDELAAFQSLNHELLRARTTPSNKEEKMNELASFDAIKKSLFTKIQQALSRVQPKWGDEHEGVVINDPNIGLVKLVTPKFKQGTSLFESIIPVTMLVEGGNIGDSTPIRSDIDRDLLIDDIKKWGDRLSEILGLNLDLINSAVGSSQYLLDPQYNRDRIFKAFGQFGDLDFVIEIPEDTNTSKFSDNVIRRLESHDRQHTDAIRVIQIKKGAAAVHLIIRWRDTINIQVDLNWVSPAAYKYRYYSRTSPLIDLETVGTRGIARHMLLNTLAKQRTPERKWSTAKGLGGTFNPEEISMLLFNRSDMNIDSFVRLVDSIKKTHSLWNIPQLIDEFEKTITSSGRFTTQQIRRLVDYLIYQLVPRPLGESVENSEQVKVILLPLAGMVPIPHIGHYLGLGPLFEEDADIKVIGMSLKSDVFAPKEKEKIFRKQWVNHADVILVHAKTISEVLARLAEMVGDRIVKELVIVTGGDRRSLAENIKKSALEGKIENLVVKSARIKVPEEGRVGDYSGTKLRQAAADGDIDEFRRMIGEGSFTRQEAEKLMNRVKRAIEEGKISVKRK